MLTADLAGIPLQNRKWVHIKTALPVRPVAVGEVVEEKEDRDGGENASSGERYGRFIGTSLIGLRVGHNVRTSSQYWR